MAFDFMFNGSILPILGNHFRLLKFENDGDRKRRMKWWKRVSAITNIYSTTESSAREGEVPTIECIIETLLSDKNYDIVFEQCAKCCHKTQTYGQRYRNSLKTLLQLPIKNKKSQSKDVLFKCKRRSKRHLLGKFWFDKKRQDAAHNKIEFYWWLNIVSVRIYITNCRKRSAWNTPSQIASKPALLFLLSPHFISIEIRWNDFLLFFLQRIVANKTKTNTPTNWGFRYFL